MHSDAPDPEVLLSPEFFISVVTEGAGASSATVYLNAMKETVFSGLGVPAEALGIEPVKKAGFTHGYYKTVHTKSGDKQVYVQPGQVLHQVQQHLLNHPHSTPQNIATATEIPTHHVQQALGHLVTGGKAKLHFGDAFSDYSHQGEYDHPEGYQEHAAGHLLPTVAAGKLQPGTKLASGHEVTGAKASGEFVIGSGIPFKYKPDEQVPVQPEHFTHGTSKAALETAKKAHAAAKKTKSVVGMTQGGGLSDTASPEVLHSHAKLLANAGAVSHAEVGHAFGHLAQEATVQDETENFSNEKPAPKTEAEQKQAVLTVIQTAGAQGIKESEVAGKAHVNAFETAKIVSALFNEDQITVFHHNGSNWVKIVEWKPSAVEDLLTDETPPELSQDAQEILRELKHPELEGYGYKAAGNWLFANHSTTDPAVFEAAVEELKAAGAITVHEKPSGDLLELNPDWKPPQAVVFSTEPEVTLEVEPAAPEAQKPSGPKAPDGSLWEDLGIDNPVYYWVSPSGTQYDIQDAAKYGADGSYSLMSLGAGHGDKAFIGVFADPQAAADYAAALDDNKHVAPDLAAELPADTPGWVQVPNGELELDAGHGVTAHVWNQTSWNLQFGEYGTPVNVADHTTDAKQFAAASAKSFSAKLEGISPSALLLLKDLMGAGLVGVKLGDIAYEVAVELVKSGLATETQAEYGMPYFLHAYPYTPEGALHSELSKKAHGKAPVEPGKPPVAAPKPTTAGATTDAIMAALKAAPNGLSAHQLGKQVFPGEKPATAWSKADKILGALETIGGVYKVGSKWKVGAPEAPPPPSPEPAPPSSNYQKIAKFITENPGCTSSEIMVGTGLSQSDLLKEGKALLAEFETHSEHLEPDTFWPKGQTPQAASAKPQLEWKAIGSSFAVDHDDFAAQVYKNSYKSNAWEAAYHKGSGWIYSPEIFDTLEDAKLWAEQQLGVSGAAKPKLTALEALAQLGGKGSTLQVSTKMGEALFVADEQLQAAYAANEVHHEGSNWVLGPHTIHAPKPIPPVVVTPILIQPDYEKFKYPVQAAVINMALQGHGTLTIGQAGKLAFPTEPKGSQYSKPQDILNKLVALGFATGGPKGPYSAVVPEASEPEPVVPEPEPVPVVKEPDYSQIKYPQEAVKKIHESLQDGPLTVAQAQKIGFADPKSSFWTAAKNILLALKKQGLAESADDKTFSAVQPAPQDEVVSQFISGGKITKEQIQQALTPGIHYGASGLLSALGLPHDVTSLSVLKKLKDQGMLEQVGSSYVLPSSAYQATATKQEWNPVSSYPELEKKILAALLQNPGSFYYDLKTKSGVGSEFFSIFGDLSNAGLVNGLSGSGISLTEKGKLHAALAAGGTYTAGPPAAAIKKTAVEALASIGGKGTTGAVAGAMPATFSIAGKQLQEAELSGQVHKEKTLWVIGPKPEPEKPKVYAGETFDPKKEKSVLYHAVFDVLTKAAATGTGPLTIQQIASELSMNAVSWSGSAHPLTESAKKAYAIQAAQHLFKMGLVQQSIFGPPAACMVTPGKTYPWPKAKTPSGQVVSGAQPTSAKAAADQAALKDVPAVTVAGISGLLGNAPIPLASLTKVGEKSEAGGSLGGGIYKDASGKKFLVKWGYGVSGNPGKYWKDDHGAHAQSEQLASMLYQAASSPVPDIRIVDMGGGEFAVASEWIGGLGPYQGSSASWRKKAHLDFALHAWLCNYDVVGSAQDNLVTAPNGSPICIDLGGALGYRAQGKPKTAEEFGSDVKEWNSFKNESGVGAYAVFNDISSQDMIESVARVAAITDDAIKALCAQYAPGTPAAKAKLAQILIARKEDLIQKAKHQAQDLIDSKSAPQAFTDPPPVPEVIQQVSVQWPKKTQAEIQASHHGPGKIQQFGNWGYFQALNADQVAADPAAAKQQAAAVLEAATGLKLDSYDPAKNGKQNGAKPYGLNATKELANQAFKSLPGSASSHNTVKGALYNYTASGYTGQNGDMRKGDYDMEAHLATQGFHQIAEWVPAGSYTERGVNLADSIIQNLAQHVGCIIQEPGFSSTSPTKPWSRTATICIHNAPGVKASNAAVWSACAGEDELLYGPDQRFMIIGVGQGKTLKGHQSHLIHVVALPTEEYQSA